MSLFSERHGYSPRKQLQFESMNKDLKIGIWNVFHEHYLSKINKDNYYYRGDFSSKYYFGIKFLWTDFFKTSLQNLDENYEITYNNLFSMYNQLEWYMVYDFIEFLINNRYFDLLDYDFFIKDCQQTLKRENAAYRIVDKRITKITSEQEIRGIEDAIENSTNEIQTHLKTALTLLSNRQNPDYRNSIKESISAVEAIARKISGKEKSTLGEALKKLRNSEDFNSHKALLSGYEKIYGYTNDKDGIRHSIFNEVKLDAEDALYMLVSCSAFVNYLRVKADKAGIIV